MKKWMLVLWAMLFILPSVQDSFAGERKKKKGTPPASEKKAIVQKSAYDKLLNVAGCESAKSNFITLHKVNGKLYFEIPVKYLGREMLLASTLSETSNGMLGDVGYKAQDPLHIKFTKKDSSIYLMNITSNAVADPTSLPLQKALERNFRDAVMNKYKIEAYSPDSTSVVINMTDLFTNDVKEFSFFPNFGIINVKGDFRKDASALGEIKSFEDNLSVKSLMSYKVSLSFWIITLASDLPVTATVTRSLLLLPEEKMRPRISDSRVGIFMTNKQLISTREDGILPFSLAHRWRIEPKDMAAYQRGEMVEPVKPIVFYIDDAFPQEWREAVKKGVLSWNAAFEKIGFKNVLQVRDFPKNDPEFDPDNLKYSCIRYLPSTTANAMGPSWVDPTTGEIVNASVLIYNDVIRLVNNWRFVLTSQVDPRVRCKKLPQDVMEESMVYVVAHEVGHCLGFMHNMAASSAYPVDSLRSASFTQKYGTTPTIMDYARFNYVAQPEDKNVKLVPPDLGVGDYFLVKWNYQPIPEAKSMLEEQAITEQWVDEKAGDPLYRYGRQQIFARYDPSALEEDLGNDPLKAGEYGVNNLKYILANLDQWIDEDPGYDQRTSLYGQLANQYYRYIMNVLYNVGGIYLTEVKEGTPGERHAPVAKATQKASLAWVLKQFKDADWLDNETVRKKSTLGVNYSVLLRNKLTGNLKTSMGNVLLSSHIASNPYRINEFLTDLYNGAFENTLKGRTLKNGDIALQNFVVDLILAPFQEEKKSGGLFGLVDAAYLPSVEEMLTYNLDESGLMEKFADQFRQIERENGIGFVASQIKTKEFGYGYGFLRAVDTKSIDNSTVYLQNLALKAQKLVSAQVAGATGDTKLHYQSLLLKINKALKNK